MLKWLWLSLAVVVLDQATKFWAGAALMPARPVEMLPFLNLTLMHNTGAAFSFLSDAAGWQRWFFIVVALGVTAVLVLWLRRLGPAERWLAGALALVIGGAVGNLWDRLAYGHVVDFIDLHAAGWHWPAFNIADSAITVGVVVILLDGFLSGRKEGGSEQ
ncbi:MAG TPA: signal peptidase II [Gammaproteobacteria bacterium]|nr:signal peptidase II [Gammaproteobacteria bacterium]